MTSLMAVVCALGMSIAVAAVDETRTAAAPAGATAWDAAMVAGVHRERSGKYLEAEQFYREAVHLAEKFEPGNPRLASSLSALGANYDNLGRYSDAERVYRRAMRIIADTQGRHSMDYATLETNLAASFTHRREPLKGEFLLTHAIATLESVGPEEKDRLALARDGLGAVMLARHKYDEAAALFEQVLTAFRESRPSWQCRTAVALNNLAVVRGFQGRQEESVELLRQSLAESEAELGKDHPVILRTLNNLAVGLASIGRFEEADAVAHRAIALAEKTLGRDHPVYGEALANYAAVLRKAGRKGEAKTFENQARGILRDNARTTSMTVDVSSFR